MRLLFASVLAALAAGPVWACGPAATEDAPVLTVDTAEAVVADLCLGYVYLLRSETPIGTVLVGDPDIVSAVPVSDRALSVTAVGEGSTNIVLADAEGNPFGTLVLSVSPVETPEETVVQETVAEAPADIAEAPVEDAAEVAPPATDAPDSADIAALQRDLATALAPQAVDSVNIRLYRGTGLTLVECRPECD
jgi:Flp pilus assembly secretin CpaC